MPFYHRLGNIPRYKHTQFFKDDGTSLYREELYSTLGFSGIYSNKYHIHMPNSVHRVKELAPAKEVDWPEAPLTYYHFFTGRFKGDGNYITGRNVFLKNAHCTIATADITMDTVAGYEPSRPIRMDNAPFAQLPGLPVGQPEDLAQDLVNFGIGQVRVGGIWLKIGPVGDDLFAQQAHQLEQALQ